MQVGHTAARARRALGWGLGCYVLCQLAFSTVLYDPEYEWRLDTLKARVAEDPKRPLLLVIGSSRTQMGFSAEMLPPVQTTAGQAVLSFNFSHPAAGPVMNLMNLRRLLREGIHPDWLVLEMMPAFLAGEGFDCLTADLGAQDLPVLAHYVSPWMLYGKYALARLATDHRPQLDFLRRHGPAWLLGERQGPERGHGPLGGFVANTSIDPGERARRIDLMHAQYAETLREYELSPAGDRATRALLDLCRWQHLPTVLLLMPESSAFRSWYSDRARATVARYLDGLVKDFDVPLLDARTWVADEDFSDGHHLLRGGQAAFSTRLEREVLQPLVEGRLVGPAIPSPGSANSLVRSGP
jgi:hypothetical protein